MKVRHVYGLATVSTRYRSFPEKQKVCGVSGNPTLSGNPLRYLTYHFLMKMTKLVVANVVEVFELWVSKHIDG